MKITFARYEHSRVGFPRIVLKWDYDGIGYINPYITVNGVIKPWAWDFGQEKIFRMEKEIEKFEKYVSIMWGDDASVQG